MTFLVAQKKDGRKDISYRVVRFIAQDDWLMDDPTKLFRLSLSYLGNYTGKILYYDIHGQLIEGSVYANGEQTGIIRPATGGDSATRSGSSGGRYYEYLTVSPLVVTRGFDPECEYCRAYGYACMVHRDNEIDEVVVTPERPTLWPCSYDSGGGGGGWPEDPNPGGGGGGGGGGFNPPPPPPPPPPAKPFPNAKYARTDIPNTMTPQKQNFCTPALWSFLDNLFGGSKDQQQMYFAYFKYFYSDFTGLKGEAVSIQGIRTSNIPIFTDAYFNTITFYGTDYSSYRNVIDRGYTVLTDIPGSPQSHTVLIIGYEDNGLVYMDPSDGTQKKISPSQIIGNFNKAITGKK